MKTQAFLITLLFSLLTIQGFSANGENESTQDKKITKTKYDYNLFKMFSINATKTANTDSTSIKSSALPNNRKKD
ncbi:hypothetical protein FRY74_00395 [Vicingus serpentipes]|jgi:hypothetical protein|uniref:Uncharacterized protein n=1 Tax=Vicingus serpentipes TaxID=1926625 RepID=A0A5C6RVV2_9FLAO|nr:hypothetical protein [Vicingus serpentipes]TXB66676.1 hypothetical protein FRY74_00395 [Vicingus serpentipes]